MFPTASSRANKLMGASAFFLCRRRLLAVQFLTTTYLGRTDWPFGLESLRRLLSTLSIKLTFLKPHCLLPAVAVLISEAFQRAPADLLESKTVT